ncbi:MAG: SPOR domain-containing protein [Treponema sp.]|nr:SPOR domain-containing protein [Treponema sp.]
MDQKRTLWIVAVAGIFLLVVFGAAVILSSAPAESARTIAAVERTDRTATGWTAAPTSPASTSAIPAPTVAFPPDTPDTPPRAELEPSAHTDVSSETVTRVNDMTVIAQNTTVYGLPQQPTQPAALTHDATTINLNTIQRPEPPASVTPTNDAGAQAMAHARTVAPASPATPAPSREATPSSQPAPAAARRTEAQTQPAATKTPAAPKTAATPKAPQPVTTTQFWVQAAAYTSKKSADNAIVVLDENKIPANIFTYQDAKGRLFYRVRVGPYVTKTEAEYWRTRIARIDTFETANSYVTSTTTTQ